MDDKEIWKMDERKHEIEYLRTCLRYALAGALVLGIGFYRCGATEYDKQGLSWRYYQMGKAEGMKECLEK